MQNKTINGFTLQRLLGTGGMAEVWYAENKIGKKAAVKILLPKLCADENVCSRFYTEAKVMVELNHPNIRQVYDYGDIDGRLAIVMEYLDGDDLKARMKRGQRFTDEELIRWWNQLVDALNYTHKKGIVHRDIKPGNIFVDREGNIKLLDFGIAKVRESISSTQTGQKLGTLMYMSPEQVKDSKHIDYRTDVYSLAVTFVHLITGKKPYDSDTSSDFEISEQIVYKPLDLSGVPDNWRAFLAPYLNKEPEQRPALRYFENTSAPFNHAESDDEGTMVGDAPVKPSPQKVEPKLEPGPKPKPSEKPKSKKGLWIGLGAVAAVAVAVFFVIFNKKPSDPELLPSPKDGKWGFIDNNGAFLIQPQYDQACPFGDGLAAIRTVDGKWGYVDTKGKMVISPQFDDVDLCFSEGLSSVKVGQKWGYINTKGEMVVSPQFDRAFDFSEGLAMIKKDNSYGFIDNEGKMAILPQYSWAGQFSEGVAPVEIDGKWGFVDKTGKLSIPAKYDYASSFSEGLALVEVDNKYGYINNKGDYAVAPQFENASSFSDGLAAVKTGKHVVKYDSDYFGDVFEEWGFINKNGKVVIPVKYQMARPFSDGLAWVEERSYQTETSSDIPEITEVFRYGFIDNTGNMVIQMENSLASDFENGLAWDEIDGKWSCFDKTGKVVYLNYSQSERIDRVCKQFERDDEEYLFDKCYTVAGCNNYLLKFPFGKYTEFASARKSQLFMEERMGVGMEWDNTKSISVYFSRKDSKVPTAEIARLQPIAELATWNGYWLSLSAYPYAFNGEMNDIDFELFETLINETKNELMNLGAPEDHIIIEGLIGGCNIESKLYSVEVELREAVAEDLAQQVNKPELDILGGAESAKDHEYVDLGLPSGILWATCNIGASKPEGYGKYYAWGETKAKTKGDNYKYTNDDEKLTKYCDQFKDPWGEYYGENGLVDNLTTLQTCDDAAAVNWGNGWRTPTWKQWEELIDNTDNHWSKQNGVNGWIFIARNGHSLFLPAAGECDGVGEDTKGSKGNYWSSSLDEDQPDMAKCFVFESGTYYEGGSSRVFLYSVRPVLKK